MNDPREVLERDHQVILKRLATLDENFDEVVAASRDSNADDEHDPEGATIAFERSQLNALAQQARDHLTEIETAIARVEDGTYGVCERCAKPIADDRLRARPVARACIECASSS